MRLSKTKDTSALAMLTMHGREPDTSACPMTVLPLIVERGCHTRWNHGPVSIEPYRWRLTLGECGWWTERMRPSWMEALE